VHGEGEPVYPCCCVWERLWDIQGEIEEVTLGLGVGGDREREKHSGGVIEILGARRA